MELYLKPLSKEDGNEIYNMLQEINSDDHGFRNEVYGLTFDEYKLWLAKNEGYARKKGLEDWMVAQSTYWLYYGKMPVGYGRIRHELNNNLKTNSGHIGYSISSSQRGKGFGKELLNLLIKQCTNLGINPVQIGVNATNIRSNKLVEKCGGILVKVTKKKNIYHIYQ